jgi:hypothetical protein
MVLGTRYAIPLISLAQAGRSQLGQGPSQQSAVSASSPSLNHRAFRLAVSMLM